MYSTCENEVEEDETGVNEICHAKSQFGLATQIGVCACYITRSLTGGIGGFNGLSTQTMLFLIDTDSFRKSSRHISGAPIVYKTDGKLTGDTGRQYKLQMQMQF